MGKGLPPIGMIAMEPKELEDIVISTIQETQVKLGFAGGSEALYLPLGSIDAEEDEGRIADFLKEFEDYVRPRLGDVECRILDQRVRITVSEEGCRYVSSLPVGPVLRFMVDAVSEHKDLETFRKELSERFPSSIWKDVDGDGFEHIVYFDDGTDPSVYCIGSECGMLIYHRFSRRDYNAFGYGKV